MYWTLRVGSILKCIADNLDQQKDDLGNVKGKEILLHERNHPVALASELLNIFDIEQLFEKSHREKRDLEVVILTENGLKDEKPLGIIIAWDLIEIDYMAD
jgi:hypothetical protein